MYCIGEEGSVVWYEIMYDVVVCSVVQCSVVYSGSGIVARCGQCCERLCTVPEA